MTAIPSGFRAASLRPDPIVAPGSRKIRSLAPARAPLFDKLDPVTFSRYLAAFFVGVAATLTWQSYLGWSAQAMFTGNSDAQVNAILLDTVKRSIEKLTASQEQMAHEINKIQAAQFVLYRHPADSRPGTAAGNPPAEADARSDWRRQPCCQWPATGTW